MLPFLGEMAYVALHPLYLLNYGNIRQQILQKFVRYKRLKEYVRWPKNKTGNPGKAVAVLKGGARERTQFTAAALAARRKRSLADFAPDAGRSGQFRLAGRHDIWS